MLKFSILCLFLFGAHVQGGRKADFFLRNPYIAGDDLISYLGFGGRNHEDSMSVRTSAAHKVLYGHYSAILENRNKKSFGSPSSLKGRSLLKKVAGTSTSVISKILTAYRRNYNSIIETAINNTNAKRNSEFETQYQKCMESSQCNKLPDLYRKCHAHCFGMSNQLANELPDVILSVLEGFCYPIETIFQKVYDQTQFKRYKKFVSSLQEMGKKNLLELTKFATDAVLFTLIERVKTDMMPFRTVIAALNLALREIEHTQPTMEDVLTNRMCFTINDVTALGEIMNVFYTDSSTIDITLGGHALLSIVSKYLPGRFQTPFSAITEGIRVMTGRICGLVVFSEDGNAGNCDQLGGFPTAGIPIPYIEGLPELRPECEPNPPSDADSMENNDDDEDEESKPDHPDPFNSAAAAPSRKKRSEGASQLSLHSHRFARDAMYTSKGNSKPIYKKKRSLLVGVSM